MGAMVAFVSTSCKKDDGGHSLGTSYFSLATVDNPQKKPSGFVFTTDSGKEMWVAGTGIPSYGPKNGSRILADYSILYDRPDSDPYDHYVRLNDYYEVLTKDAVVREDGYKGEINGDPIYVRKIWVSGGYINIDFLIESSGGTNILNLVSYTQADYGDGKIHLEFNRQKAFGGKLLDLGGIVSFDPDPVLPEGARLPVDIVIHWKTSIDNMSYELTYDKNIEEEPSAGIFKIGKAVIE